MYIVLEMLRTITEKKPLPPFHCSEYLEVEEAELA
jgi:hypothetical protein